MDNITILKEGDAEKKQKKKRTYAEQAERIKAYLKNRYATDADFKEKTNKERLIRSNLKYNTDEEYRLKKKQYNKERRDKNKIKNDDGDDKKQLADIINKLKNANLNELTLNDITNTKKLYDKLIKKYPDFILNDDIKNN